MVDCWSSRNLTEMIRAARMMTSGRTESMWSSCSPGIFVVASGNDRRQERAKRVFRLSRIQAARAMVGRGSAAEARIDWTTYISGSTRETPLGMRFLRYKAGPRRYSY